MSSPNLFFSTPVWATKIKDYLTMNEKMGDKDYDKTNFDLKKSGFTIFSSLGELIGNSIDAKAKKLNFRLNKF